MTLGSTSIIILKGAMACYCYIIKCVTIFNGTNRKASGLTMPFYRFVRSLSHLEVDFASQYRVHKEHHTCSDIQSYKSHILET